MISSTYIQAYNAALDLMDIGLEIRSSLKQAASDAGIAEGDEMGAFVRWAEDMLGVA